MARMRDLKKEKKSSDSRFKRFIRLWLNLQRSTLLRLSVEDEVALKSAEEAHHALIQWFTKHNKGVLTKPTCQNLGGIPSYVVGFPDPKLAMVAMILVSDVYGFEAPNLRKLADKVAAAGFFVAVPDFLKGDPYNPENSKPTWLKDHSPEEGFENAKVVIQDLKSRGFSAIGAAGFCWGGKVVGELAKLNSIHATMILHPSFVTVDDIKEVEVPLAVLGAEFDGDSPPELLT
ncbi:Dienelactone hydrolase [Parasponia andersonii]|uniref:Dienelactone hydrolase n=1 Tax=Parasponia andersonii TaxID=3476 RepID=A0A2P5E3S9_PARAD|nr:Dienelactone hydrolase [Parasponia andersonii]